MHEAIELIKYTFDNLENHNALIKKSIAIFIDEPGATAYAKASDYIYNLPLEKRYTGYDHKVYPIYELVKRDFR